MSSFEIPPLEEDIDYLAVHEYDFAVATPNPDFDHLVTERVNICKAVAMYHQDTRQGLLAHLSSSLHITKSLDALTDAFERDMHEVDVSIMAAADSSNRWQWPSLESICDHFMHTNPRSLRVDAGNGKPIRGFALDLKTGDIKEIGKPGMHLRRYHSQPEILQPIPSG